MTWNEAARLRQQRRREERKANPRPGDDEARKARSKKRWHEVRKHDVEYRANRVEGLKRRRWKLFNGTIELFNKLWVKQEGKCAICGSELNLPSEREGTKRTREATWDHCHRTMRPRGILCLGCNAKLGWLENYQGQIKEYLDEFAC